MFQHVTQHTHKGYQFNYGTGIDAFPTPSIVVSPYVNTICVCVNGCSEEPIVSVILGSRRFSISLEISVAEILIMIVSVSQ